MAKDFLYLNHAKTEFVVFDGFKDLEKVKQWTVVDVADVTLLPFQSVPNIGVMKDYAHGTCFPHQDSLANIHCQRSTNI